MLQADVPGAKPEGLTITLERRVLSIRAEVDEHAPAGYSPIYQEYQVGDFECEFTLSGDFDPDRIEAGLSDGVLRLTIPRAEQATVLHGSESRAHWPLPRPGSGDAHGTVYQVCRSHLRRKRDHLAGGFGRAHERKGASWMRSIPPSSVLARCPCGARDLLRSRRTRAKEVCHGR